jgi:hypothetical protein
MNWQIIRQLALPGTLCCAWQIILIVIGILIGRGYRVRLERP